MSNSLPTIKGLPWFGIAFELIKDPTGFMQKTNRAYPELVNYKFFGSNGFMVTSPDTVREVLVTKSDSFRKADVEMDRMGLFMGNGLVTNNSRPSHKRQRQLVQPSFHHQRIANYADTIVDYSTAMVDSWQSGEVRDMAEELRELTMFIVSKTLFDADRDELSGSAEIIGEAIETFQQRTDEDFAKPFVMPLWLPTRRNKRFNSARRNVEETLTEIIKERQQSGKDNGDLLSMLLMSVDEDGNGMSERQLLDEVITLFLAGHETTSNALMWTLYLLTQNRSEMEQLKVEIDAALQGRLPTMTDLAALPFSAMVVKEAMRLFPPVYHLNGRVANEDVEIGGYLVPKDSYVSISPWGLHHNPRYFADSERFDPQRFNAENEPLIPKYAYIPFGAGPRVCIGNAFAMMEAQLILVTMLQRFDFTLSAEQEIKPLTQITLSNTTGMHMQISERVFDSAEKDPLPAFAD